MNGFTTETQRVSVSLEALCVSVVSAVLFF